MPLMLLYRQQFLLHFYNRGCRGDTDGCGQQSCRRAELEDFARFLKGRDPFEIEYIWNTMFRRVQWTGGPVTMSAISAIELALWDVKGKALGVPVYELFGGKVRDRLEAYTNGWFRDKYDPARNIDTPEEFAQRAQAIADEGYQALKFYPFQTGTQLMTKADCDAKVALVAAVREQVGDRL